MSATACMQMDIWLHCWHTLQCSSNHVMTCCALQDRCFVTLQVATDLTVHQTDDILWIRRLFYRKLGQLARHRKALLSQITQSQVDTCHASEKLTGLTDWGQCLRQNGLDEYCTWLQFALCLMRGVRLPSAWSSFSAKSVTPIACLLPACLLACLLHHAVAYHRRCTIVASPCRHRTFTLHSFIITVMCAIQLCLF